MTFGKILDMMTNNSLVIPQRKKHDPYWGTLPRMCKICAYMSQDDPPESLRKAGVKPAYMCLAYKLACYLAVTLCNNVSPPVYFRPKGKTKR